MKYVYFRVRRDADGWHLVSEKLDVLAQLKAYPTRRAAIEASAGPYTRQEIAA